MDTMVMGIPAALGFSLASGMRAPTALASLALLANRGVIDTPDSLASIGTTPALPILILVAVADTLGASIPGVDRVLHRLMGPIAIAAGALSGSVVAGMVDTHDPLLTSALAIVMGVVSGVVFWLRRFARPIVRAFVPASAVSSVESATAVGVVASTLLSPWLTMALFIGVLLLLLLLVVQSIRWVMRSMKWLWRRYAMSQSKQWQHEPPPMLTPNGSSASGDDWDLGM